MLFNSGTTSLLSHTRVLAGDPASAPSQLFADQIVKDFINTEYLGMYDIARQFGVGQGEKRSYADIVADQLYYELPVGFMKMLLVEVEGDGVDLTTSTASPTSLKPLSGDVALQGYEAGIYSSTEYYFIHNQHLGIVSPVGTAGTNTLRLTYEGEGTDLAGDTDEPELPRTYHSLICYLAAIGLRETMDLDVRGLERVAARKMGQFMQAMHDNMADFEGQAYVAGLNKHNTVTKHGRLVEN
jgi:hypothetical protein